MKIGGVVYHCARTSAEGDDIITYADPVAYKTRFNYLTVQPTRVALNNMAGFYTTEDFGEHTADGWNMVANYGVFEDVFKPGDLMYVDGATPVQGAENGVGANALITSVREQNRAIFYTLNKLDGV